MNTALAQMEMQSHSVIVLHDSPTGAMDQLSRFLDEVDSFGYEITLDLPADCVPMIEGSIDDHEAYSDLVTAS